MWYTNYTSSTQWYKSIDSQADVRITGFLIISSTIGTTSAADDWVHIGNTSYITGDITDDLTLNPITGNNTTLIFEFEFPGVGPTDPMGNPPPPMFIPIGNVPVNTTNGQYNISFTMPTNFPGGIWGISVSADFPNAPVGGSYYALDQSHQFDIGTESEAALFLNASDVLVEVNNQLIIEVDVHDVAAYFSIAPPGQEGLANISNAAVEFFWDANGANTGHLRHRF